MLKRDPLGPTVLPERALTVLAEAAPPAVTWGTVRGRTAYQGRVRPRTTWGCRTAPRMIEHALIVARPSCAASRAGEGSESVESWSQLESQWSQLQSQWSQWSQLESQRSQWESSVIHCSIDRWITRPN